MKFNSLFSKILEVDSLRKLLVYVSMFSNCQSLISIDISKLDIKMIRYMNNIFSDCISLTFINASNVDASNVINMNSLFSNCRFLSSIGLTNFKTEGCYIYD